MINLKSSCHVNSIIFIESVEANELHTGRLIEEDLSAFLNNIPIHHAYHSIGNQKDLFKLLHDLQEEAETKLFKPIIQIDAHGDLDRKGIILSPSNEIILWKDLAKIFRKINRAADNNLLVILNSCFGFHGIEAVDIKHLTPFLYLIAPKASIQSGVIQDQLPKFYRTLFNTGDLQSAFQSLNESNDFRIFYAEKLLAISFVRYLATKCRGKGAKSRINRLLTEIKEKNPKIDINLTRKKLRSLLKMDNASLDRFKNSFLLANHHNNTDRFKLDLDTCISVASTINSDGL